MYLSTYLVLVIVAFTKKKKEKSRISNKEDRATNRANTQPSSEYFSVRT